MKSGIADFSATFGARVIGAGLSVGIQSCLAWFLLPEGRGSYAVCLTFATLLSIAFSFGCDTATVYFVAKKRISLSEGVLYTFIFGLAASFAAVGVGYILLQTPLAFTTKASPAAFHLALVIIPTTLLCEIFLQILTSLGRFRVYASFFVIRVLSRFILMLICVAWLSQGVKGALFACVLSDASITLLILGYYVVRCGVVWVKPRLREMREMFFYGARYYLGRLSNTVNVQLGTVILAFFAPENEIGVFALACVMTFQVDMIPSSIVATLVPRVSDDQAGRKVLVAQCARVAFLVCGALSLTLALLATPIIRIAFSPAFLPAVNIVRILVIGMLARSGCKVFVPYLLATNHPATASLAVAVGMFVNLTLMALLLPVFGLHGAAISVTVNYLISSAILVVAFSHFSGMSIREISAFKRSDFDPVKNAIKGWLARSKVILVK